jgi:MFS family permease
VVNVALPALQTALHATATDIQWVVESYALLLASLLLSGGSLGDLFSRRKVFLYGVLLFAIGSSWCGLAPSITSLIVAREVQGIGATFLVPGSLAIISASYTEIERGHAIGTWSGFTAITAAIGPLLGGWLVEHAPWRWVFFINLPIAIFVIALSLWRIPESRDEATNKRLDWQGATLVTFVLGAIIYALINSSATASGPEAVIWILGLAGGGSNRRTARNARLRRSIRFRISRCDLDLQVLTSPNTAESGLRSAVFVLLYRSAWTGVAVQTVLATMFHLQGLCRV